jgi:hypothetical protein
MSMKQDDPLVTDDVLAAARELIRSAGDGYVVGIDRLLAELSDKFDRFRVTPDMHELLYLILTLWGDPHIDQPESGWIEFAWNDVGFDHVSEPGSFLARVREHLITERRKEDG